ncbi:CRP/FNR family transcriptional regulator [Fontibacillus phaseoli]|uniref:CRP/FNR family transcriptional regulator n=1 Tax=Fontibacillus phaseoli TaxID=1416533 RepID=A0A369B7Y0_9BACL|nr:Crp/Fnr family transcriptional regulator [Fontibacillus phaseoli]RCX16656.1 CRP/FNR family transcriptional regulator [Fontibacillus phaseoli]
MACKLHSTGAGTAPSCLSRVPVFSQLRPEEVELLHTVMRSLHFAKGEMIFQEGDRSDSLFVLSRGVIKLTKLEDNGKEHIIRLLFPGDFFGQFSLLQEKPHYANASAADDADICCIHRADFLEVLRRSPDTAARFMTALSAQLEEADSWAAVLTLLEADRRLAKMLLYFQHKSASSSSEFTLPVSKKELAGVIGATPETLSRKLGQLVSSGIAAVSGRKIIILKEQELRRLAGEA